MWNLVIFSEFPYLPNQGFKPLAVENQGYGYIPPQVPIYSQPPVQTYPFPYPYGGAFQPYSYGGGYYPNYGSFPQKPYGSNYLQTYDAYYGGSRPQFKWWKPNI